MMEDQTSKIQRIADVTAAFSPAGPINDKELFAGRSTQVMQCVEALFQRGRHIALYGERGVGKTSLAIVLPEIVKGAGAATDRLTATRIDCNTASTYQTIWRHVFRDLGYTGADRDKGDFEPEDIRFHLERFGKRVLIVLDEIDRVIADDAGNQGLTLITDTMKTLSDHSVNATIMVVGVANDIIYLLGEHDSIVRSLVQVHMPRMTDSELGDIVDKGMERARLIIPDAERAKIVAYAEGFPHYVHLVAQAAGLQAVYDERNEVTADDLARSLAEAVNSALSMRHEYQIATASPQPVTRFEEVLLACAYAPRDEFGTFRPRDVRKPLSLLTGRNEAIANFLSNITELSGEDRGWALQKEGKKNNFRYRFRNPLLQPYVKIRALATGFTTETRLIELEELQRKLSAPTAPKLPF